MYFLAYKHSSTVLSTLKPPKIDCLNESNCDTIVSQLYATSDSKPTLSYLPPMGASTSPKNWQPA